VGLLEFLGGGGGGGLVGFFFLWEFLGGGFGVGWVIRAHLPAEDEPCSGCKFQRRGAAENKEEAKREGGG